MTAKTRKNKKIHMTTTKKYQKEFQIYGKILHRLWGKNKPLEKFWEGLASNKYVVVIYKNGKYKYVKQPNSRAQNTTNFYNELDNNKEIEAVLSSNLSQDAYEIHLYPKAKDKSVEYVIKNYKKYFKSIYTTSNDVIDSERPLMKKVRVPS